ncbi:MAG TPA: hypothetical protein VFH25_08610 [Nitrososphaeraceae archaeon]|nr:hypothetical protein [Nitrososphaeraceae archaeon]
MADDVLNYCICIVVITSVTFMLNPFITYVVNEQEAYASIICGDGSNNVVVAEMQNCSSYKSYFYYSGLFSDLSRNMTSSPPGSNSSSDLIEDNNEDTEDQDDVENNAELNLQDETAATELQENDDGNNANIQ